jgi:hypothetical protein
MKASRDAYKLASAFKATLSPPPATKAQLAKRAAAAGKHASLAAEAAKRKEQQARATATRRRVMQSSEHEAEERRQAQVQQALCHSFPWVVWFEIAYRMTLNASDEYVSSALDL